MDFNKKVERQYEKWETLCDNGRDEFDQKKIDKAFAKLQDMFPDKESFQKFWDGKMKKSFEATTFRIK